MATRMQQRRGTAAQWTAANPILAAGEIGFETDTSKFKVGNGSSAWASLKYFTDAESILGGLSGIDLPATLDTLNELAAAMGDDPAFLTTIATNLSNHATDTTDIHGIANTALLATTAAVNTAIAISAGSSSQDATAKANGAEAAAIANAAGALTAHEADTTGVHGIANTSLLATMTQVNTAVSNHEADTTQVHGIADTSVLATATTVATAKSEAIAVSAATLLTHEEDTTGVHGIANTSLLATTANITNAISALTKSSVGLDQVNNTSDANKPVSTATATAITTAVSDHNTDTTNVHGIADTSVLVTQTQLTNAINGAEVTQSDLAGTGLVWDSVNSEFDLDNTYITTATQTALDLKSPLASPTFTGTVSGITKTMVGLGSVDNTADADKPVSSATTTALALKATVASVDLKAPIASPTFTGTVTIPAGASISGFAPLASPALTGVPTAPTAAAATNTTQVATTAFVRGEVTALVNGASAALDTLGELAAALTADEATAATLSTLVGTKAPLASPTFTGTVTLPTGTVTSGMILDGTIVDADINASAAIAQSKISGLSTSLGLKANVADPTFTGTVTVAAAGVAFTDGTQTKAGVPSITNIPTAIAAGAHALAAGRADQFIPLTGAVVITLPATGYSTGQSIDFYQESSTGAYFASTNSVVGTPGLKFRTTNSVATAMKTSSGWLVFGDLSA
jgi:hypothetical protein